MKISERVLRILEWDSIITELASRCATSTGREIAQAIKPLAAEKAKSRLKEITELKETMLQSEQPDFTGAENISPLLDIAEKEGVLQISDVCVIRNFITASNRIINFISKHKDILVSISVEFGFLARLNDLKDLLYSSVTDNNELNTNKYPALKNIKDNLSGVKQEIEKKLNSIFNSSSLSSALQEKIHTIRNERYVILIKTNMKDKVKGNIHDLSASGATLYIEPEEITHLNNKMIMLERDYKIEISRILRELTKEIAKHSGELRSNATLLARLDILTASAKFSIEVKGSEPQIVNENIIDLQSARHPLLFLMSPEAVVPNDISIGKEYNCMIISGANTGGKTVLLKTVGLCALLAMHGLHIPAGPDSAIGIFSNILADIGDDQSILESLSTYSGQIVIIKEMIERANKDTLILVDEILVGTNPRQGAVLAQSVLEKLAGTDSIIIVATHYPELKELPSINRRFTNASVSFDIDTLRPTYRLRTGIPGTSYALDIAKNYGMPDEVISRAKELLDSREMSTEALIENIQKHKEEIEEEQKKIKETNEQLIIEKNKNIETKMKLDQRIEEIKNERGIDFIEEINRYRKDITDKLNDLQNKNVKELEKIKHELKETKDKVSAELRKDRQKRFINKYLPFVPEKAKQGDYVFIASLEKTGRISNIDTAAKRVSVVLGNAIKAKYSFEDLLSVSVKKAKKKEKKEPEAARPATRHPDETDKPVPGTLQTRYNTIDLRGLKADEAINRLETELDRMMRSGIDTAVIIHGHGTGALKLAVRSQLKFSRYVAKFRPGEQGEGGDGVTIALLNR
ncbi:MAG: endonuclease MutS2 [Spirochaetota bacterium]